jgi:signal peptidase I
MLLLFSSITLVLLVVPPTITPVMLYAQPVASIFILQSNSMFPNLHQNDIVIVDSHIPFSSLKLGDIIAFKTFGTTSSGQHETIVHRVAQIVNDTHGDRILRAKGDANNDSIPSLDYPIFQQNYIGKVVYIVDSNDTSAILSHLQPSTAS